MVEFAVNRQCERKRQHVYLLLKFPDGRTRKQAFLPASLGHNRVLTLLNCQENPAFQKSSYIQQWKPGVKSVDCWTLGEKRTRRLFALAAPSLRFLLRQLSLEIPPEAPNTAQIRNSGRYESWAAVYKTRQDLRATVVVLTGRERERERIEPGRKLIRGRTESRRDRAASLHKAGELSDDCLRVDSDLFRLGVTSFRLSPQSSLEARPLQPWWGWGKLGVAITVTPLQHTIPSSTYPDAESDHRKFYLTLFALSDSAESPCQHPFLFRESWLTGSIPSLKHVSGQ
ncbi:hypothetical protein B0H13DRAFT_2450741 [Mycena leptocephala]|nr:hypothetical protein B0H13DRAFT_2450741 [Mycena leptocephala]